VLGYLKGLLLLVIWSTMATLLLVVLGMNVFADYEVWRATLAVVFMLLIGVTLFIGFEALRLDRSGAPTGLVVAVLLIILAGDSLELHLSERYGLKYLLIFVLYALVGNKAYDMWTWRWRYRRRTVNQHA